MPILKDMKAKWNQLKNLDENALVEIRGYLYQSEDGAWILSDEPNIKSCCIGSDAKKDHQIQLQGDFAAEKINRPIAIQGKLHRDLETFSLIEAQMVDRTSKTPIMSLSLFLAVAVFLFLKRGKGRRPLPL